MKKHLLPTVILFVLAICLEADAQVDTIRLQDKRLETSFLKPGLSQYLVYYHMKKEPKKLRVSLWLRNIAITKRDGDRVFIINQHWYGTDTSRYFKLYSINKFDDFAPAFHSETVLDTTSAYNWYADKISGADSIANNPQKDFFLKFTLPNFNWNLDIETLEMLPLSAGKAFAINFYDAGLEPPRYVVYKVIGSELIMTVNNQRVDCWKLTTEGFSNGHHYTETYWISKKSHEFLKEEDVFPTGRRYKIKLPGCAPDLVSDYAGSYSH